MDAMTFSLPIPAEANALLDRDPLALLIGMVLDQRIAEPWRIPTDEERC
jgi:hypothetical protein